MRFNKLPCQHANHLTPRSVGSDCKFSECADSPCLDFLLRECEAETHEEIRQLWRGACTLTPPSPPSPPSPPPLPPLSPPPPSSPPPPPYVAFSQREAARETRFDVDCPEVSFDECRDIQAAHAAAHPESPNKITATLAECEGADGEEHCFRRELPPEPPSADAALPAPAPVSHATFPSQGLRLRRQRRARRPPPAARRPPPAARRPPPARAHAGPPRAELGALYTFLLPRHEAEFGPFNPRRCAVSLLPYCACKTFSPPPPATKPPPPFALTIQDEWDFASRAPELDGPDAYVGAFTKTLACRRKPPQSTIDAASATTVACERDNGRETCTRHCAAEHLGFLRAVVATGRARPPAPPQPAPPPARPPAPPSPELPPSNFNPCTDECDESADGRCTDGGRGSLYPPTQRLRVRRAVEPRAARLVTRPRPRQDRLHRLRPPHVGRRAVRQLVRVRERRALPGWRRGQRYEHRFRDRHQVQPLRLR